MRDNLARKESNVTRYANNECNFVVHMLSVQGTVLLDYTNFGR
jgi:hypothetical protein